MTKRQRGDIHVTNHALLRFIERAGGIDIEALRKSLELSLKRAASRAESIGETDFVIAADGLRYLVRNGAVITVLNDNMPVKLHD